MMKKNLILLGISVLTSLSSYSQNVWSGTSTPTYTTGSVGIGVVPISNIKLGLELSNTTSPWKEGIVIHNNSTNITNGILFRITDQLSTVPVTPAVNIISFYRSYNYFKHRIQIGDLSSITPYHDWKLSVDGSIMAKRLVIQVDKWADYVFADDYKLAPLSEVSDYIAENKHLPGVPSESEIVEKGLDVSHMNTILMQKVEELTLYMIEMQKENEALKKRVISLETK